MQLSYKNTDNYEKIKKYAINSYYWIVFYIQKASLSNLPIRQRKPCHKESALPDWQESLYGPPVRKRRRPRCVVLCCFLISGNAESCLAQEDGGAAGHIVLQLHGEGGELTADRVVGTLLFKQSDV